MLNVRLDPETEQQLADILAHEKALNHSDLVKRLIRERWLTLKLDSTFVERRGDILSICYKVHLRIYRNGRHENKRSQTIIFQ